MAEEKFELKDVYPVPEEVKAKAYIKGKDEYEKLWKRSIDDPRWFLG